MTLNATQLCIVVLNRTLVKRKGTAALRLNSIMFLQLCVAARNEPQWHVLKRLFDEVEPVV